LSTQAEKAFADQKNVKVVVRCRPLNSVEKANGNVKAVKLDVR
jgi:hypothetical protein